MMRPGRDSSDVAGGRRRQDFFEVPRFDVPFFEVLYAEAAVTGRRRRSRPWSRRLA
jgi:hypothetical protein